MLFFDIDPRDGLVGNGATACATCCCQPAAARPGEINKWRLNYAPWSVPIGGRGLSTQNDFSVEDITARLETTGNQRPKPETVLEAILVGGAIAARQLAATDADGDTLTYALLPLEGPRHGTATVSSTGVLNYTPDAGWSGVDRFYYTVDDGAGHVAIGEIAVRVNDPNGVQYAAPLASPALEVLTGRVVVDSRTHVVTFPVRCSPTAVPGDVYRLTVRQQALDCNCEPFVNIACFDVVISKC